VLLNMADVFAKGGGSLDVLKLAKELGAPVAMVSATQETGLDAVNRFLRQEHSQGLPALLPVLQDLPQSRKWASQVDGESITGSIFRAHGAAGWTMYSCTRFGGRLFSCWCGRSSKPCLESANP